MLLRVPVFQINFRLLSATAKRMLALSREVLSKGFLSLSRNCVKQNSKLACANLKIMEKDPSQKELFLALSSPGNVAALFGLNYKQLAATIYNTPPNRLYNTFPLSKKSGGYRLVKSPCLSLKIIQKRLSDILLEVYTQKPSAHGFSVGKSILTNAQGHVGKKHVFNIDLENFFDTIHFGRVKGMFMGKPYHLPHAPATVLAQICCHQETLPQGAPTSPVITNMICAQLDSQLQRLAKKYKCTYSRYVDDITFSFSCRLKRIPRQIIHFENDEASPGHDLFRIIDENGFKINPKKTRLNTGSQRKEVTGLIVNEKPNVRRRFVKQIRSMLYAWEKFGYEGASNELFEKYYTKQRASESKPEFINVLKGKLLFLQMVKGPRDQVYVGLAKRFNHLVPKDYKSLRYIESPDKEKNAIGSIWVLETLYDDHNDEVKASQGTGFMLNGVGLVTCAHVVSENGEIVKNIKAFQCNSIGNKYDITVKKIDQHRDIAILELTSSQPSEKTVFTELHPPISEIVEQKNPIIIMGFPAYKVGQSAYLADGKIASVFTQSGVKKFEIDILIREGNSGGPVLNTNYEVIGIATEGAEKSGGNNSVTRISELYTAFEQ
jgi:hypothetical protein